MAKSSISDTSATTEALFTGLWIEIHCFLLFIFNQVLKGKVILEHSGKTLTHFLGRKLHKKINNTHNCVINAALSARNYLHIQLNCNSTYVRNAMLGVLHFLSTQ